CVVAAAMQSAARVAAANPRATLFVHDVRLGSMPTRSDFLGGRFARDFGEHPKGRIILLKRTQHFCRTSEHHFSMSAPACTAYISNGNTPHGISWIPVRSAFRR